MPAAERSESSSFRFVAIVLVLVVAAAQEEADEESGADRDQQRLAGIGADGAPHLVGDGAEVDVVDPLAHAVVLVLHRVGRRVVFVAGVVLGLAEAGARVGRARARIARTAGSRAAGRAEARVRSGGSRGRFFHGGVPPRRLKPIAGLQRTCRILAAVRVRLDSVSHSYSASEESAPVHVLDDVTLDIASGGRARYCARSVWRRARRTIRTSSPAARCSASPSGAPSCTRSEEHTSEL